MTDVLLKPGIGIDRDTGAPSENPEAVTDLRNVIGYQRSWRLRGGIASAVETLASGSMICHVSVFRAAAKIVYITYDQTTTDVAVWTADLQGQSSTLLATWGALPAGATAPPQFTTAESYGVLVLTHDEANVTHRLATQRYDPAAGTPFDTVTADLDGAGAAAVKFRGVYTWLGYVFGWGFGSASDPDRSEVIRSSAPDDPTSYDPNHYFRIGERTIPVIGLQAVASALLVVKSGSTWAIDGDQRANWSIRLIDPFVGGVSARAMWNVNGRCHWWSEQGPRYSDGGAISDAGLSLDLTGNPPADLPVPGSTADMFALYYPDERHLVYHAPAAGGGSMLCWVADLRNPDGISWAWWTMGVTMRHGVIANAEAVNTIPPGTASAVTASGAVGGGDPSMDVDWTHNNVVGDETIELWYETPGGVWSKLKEFPYSSVSGATGSTSFSGAPLVNGTGMVALRYRRAGRYATSYESSNPDDWPAACKASVTITAVATPSNVAVVYSPTTGDATVTWVNGDPAQDLDIELNNSVDTASQSEAAASTTSVFTYGAGNVQDKARQRGLLATPSYALTNVQTWVRARVRHKIGAVLGNWTAWSAAARCTYEGAGDGADAVLSGNKKSVSLGTSVEITGTMPSSRVGDLTVRMAQLKNTYYTVPTNGGCTGNGSDWPTLDTVVHMADPAPFKWLISGLSACSQCLSVGQQINMGTMVVIFGWQKSGDIAPHGWGKYIPLPGSIGGTHTCGA